MTLLTDEEIKQLDFDNCGSLSFAENQMAYARAIEAKVIEKLLKMYEGAAPVQAQEPDKCGTCGNHYLAIRTDIYEDKREFVYCDCCGAMADRKTWNRASR